MPYFIGNFPLKWQPSRWLPSLHQKHESIFFSRLFDLQHQWYWNLKDPLYWLVSLVKIWFKILLSLLLELLDDLKLYSIRPVVLFLAFNMSWNKSLNGCPFGYFKFQILLHWLGQSHLQQIFQHCQESSLQNLWSEACVFENSIAKKQWKIILIGKEHVCKTLIL